MVCGLESLMLHRAAPTLSQYSSRMSMLSLLCTKCAFSDLDSRGRRLIWVSLVYYSFRHCCVSRLLCLRKTLTLQRFRTKWTCECFVIIIIEFDGIHTICMLFGELFSDLLACKNHPESLFNFCCIVQPMLFPSKQLDSYCSMSWDKFRASHEVVSAQTR